MGAAAGGAGNGVERRIGTGGGRGSDCGTRSNSSASSTNSSNSRFAVGGATATCSHRVARRGAASDNREPRPAAPAPARDCGCDAASPLTSMASRMAPSCDTSVALPLEKESICSRSSSSCSSVSTRTSSYSSSSSSSRSSSRSCIWRERGGGGSACVWQYARLCRRQAKLMRQRHTHV